MNSIADRIDIAMHLAGIKTQADLSRQSGVPGSSIVRILKGKSQPTIENLSAISDACNVSIDWIVNGTDKKTATTPEVSLTYVTAEELVLLTQFREANKMGKSLIKTASKTAPKDSPLHAADKPE